MTFSIVARCTRTEQLGMAVSSSSPAVAARCAHAKAGVGVVASQNITDPRLGPKTLLAMAEGHSAPEAVKMNHKGKTYFPHLPPHLVNRFFFDPNRGEIGQLVFMVEYVDEIVGDDYLLLNVLSGKDLYDLKKVADPNEANSKWNNAISDLVGKVETFKESAVRRGTFIADDSKTELVPASDLVNQAIYFIIFTKVFFDLLDFCWC